MQHLKNGFHKNYKYAAISKKTTATSKMLQKKYLTGRQYTNPNYV